MYKDNVLSLSLSLRMVLPKRSSYAAVNAHISKENVYLFYAYCIYITYNDILLVCPLNHLRPYNSIHALHAASYMHACTHLQTHILIVVPGVSGEPRGAVETALQSFTDRVAIVNDVALQ